MIRDKMQPVEITSPELVLLWDALRSAIAENPADDPVRKKDLLILLRKLRAATGESA